MLDGRDADDPGEMQDTVKESARAGGGVFGLIADIIEQKITPLDWRCADAESEENVPDRTQESRLTRRRRFCKAVCRDEITSVRSRSQKKA